jgi:RNA polymerase sigma factor (sigma-70 family)
MSPQNRPVQTIAYVTIAMTETSTTVTDASDAELISQVRAGDIDAYGLLYDRHRDAAMRLARQLATAAEADDLVSESFAKLLPILQGGGGPDISFRAYLLTCVRRAHIDRVRAGRRTQPTDDLEPFDPGTPFEDPAVEAFERTATARAFASLPERWQLVLWHTEVEGEKPGEIAPLLGMTANSVAALAYRAREGLRQAYLRSHLADTADDSCRWVTEHLGGFVRGGLARRDHAKVEEHLDDCRTCTAVYLELVEVNSNLRVLLAPLLLGSAAAGYLTAAGHTGIAATAPWWLRGRKVLRGHQGAAAAAVAAVAVTAIAATAVIGTRDTGSDQTMGDDSGLGSELTDDGPSAGGTDGPRAHSDDPKSEKKGDDRPNRDSDRDRDRDRADEDDVDVDDPNTTAPSDPVDEPSDPSEETDDPSDPTEPTDDPTEPTDDPTEPTDDPTEPTDDPTEPTDDPSEPSDPQADLGVGPEIEKQDFLGLLWNELTIPAEGVQQVDQATMIITVEDLVLWNTSSDDDTGDWACSQADATTIVCTLSDVDRRSDPQDLGLDMFTGSTSSDVVATIYADDYRDPNTANNSVGTTVVL